MHTFSRSTQAIGLGAGLLTLSLAPQAAQAQGTLQTIMSGLNSPYGLAFGPDGGLYVAEAGTGGSGPSIVNGNGETVSFGDTGSVAEYLNGVQSTVISGLPSLDAATGGSATGITGLTVDSSGDLFGVIGLGSVEANRNSLVAALPAGNNAGDLGQLVGLNTSTNTVTTLSDLVPYETQNYTANNPDRTTPEANPYGLTALSGGGFAVTDGGGNVALKVAQTGGAPTLLSVFPAVTNPLFPGVGGPTYQSVPTGIVQGKNGNLFVGEFTGFPFPAGAANIFSVAPTNGASSVFASGFTSITGLAVGSNGDLYVLDQTTTTYAGPPSDAQLFQVDPTTGAKTLLTDLAPGSTYSGLIAGSDGSLYISSQGNGNAGAGSVLRFHAAPAVPEPSSLALLACGLLPVGLALRAQKRRRA